MIKFPPGDTHFGANAWQTYQRLQYETAVRHTRQQRIALDCGAHAGIMSLRMVKTFEQVHAFEPVHHRLLKENMVAYPNFTVHPVCVSDAPGALHMNIGVENSGGCWIDGTGELAVQAVTIDSLNFTGVDFVKMDLEGWEYPALLGAEQTILRNKPVLMLEYENSSPNKPQIETRLTQWGYEKVFQKNADHVWKTNL